MVHFYVAAYAAAWAVVALATYVLGRRWCAEEQPPHSRALTSALAGAMWPIMVVGLLEAATVALMSGSHVLRDPAPAPVYAGNVAPLP